MIPTRPPAKEDAKAANLALAIGGESGFESLYNGWKGSGVNAGFIQRDTMGTFWSADIDKDGQRRMAYFTYNAAVSSGLTYRSPYDGNSMSCRCVKQPSTVSNIDILPSDNMVYIEGGTYRMGTDATDVQQDEGPAHTVRVDDFLPQQI